MRTIFAVLFAVLVFAALFTDSDAVLKGKKKRLLKKLVKGAMVAKILKPKLLPLPLPIPIPIPIGIHKTLDFHHPIPWAVHEPVWAPPHHGGGYNNYNSFDHGGY